MDKKHIPYSKDEMVEIYPKKPRNIEEDIPKHETSMAKEAKLSKDSRDQYFVRFPRKMAEILSLEKVKSVSFIVNLDPKNAKPETTEVTLKLYRK